MIFIAGGRRDSLEDSLEDNMSFDFMPNYFAGMYVYISRLYFFCTLANIPIETSYDRSLPLASRFAALEKAERTPSPRLEKEEKLGS